MKPTLEEVKKHFENAEKIMSLQGTVFLFKLNYHYFDNGVFCYDTENNSREVWNPEKGFAEIITYKEKTFSLTADQLRSITDPQVKQWFPEVFETVLEVGKWYKADTAIVNYQGSKSYGIGLHGIWCDDFVELKGNNFTITEATEAEVFEALKNEAVKRFNIGDSVLSAIGGKREVIKRFNLNYYMPLNNLVSDFESPTDTSVSIFNKGKWAEIVPTKTKAEAEKELNCKIVD